MIKLQEFIEKTSRFEKRLIYNSIAIMVGMITVLIIAGLLIGDSGYGQLFMLCIPVLFLILYFCISKWISKNSVPVCPFCGKSLVPGWARVVIASRHCCFCGKKIIEDMDTLTENRTDHQERGG